MWIEINCAHTFSHSPPIRTREARRREHCLASHFLIQQIGPVYQLRGVRDFHLYSTRRSVCVCSYIWQLIQHTLFIYLARERWCIAYCLSQVGPGGHLPHCRLRGFMHGVISRRHFHVAAAGVCDRFHHLDESVLMNILIISLNARACWVSSFPPFSEINLEKVRLSRESTPAGP